MLDLAGFKTLSLCYTCFATVIGVFVSNDLCNVLHVQLSHARRHGHAVATARMHAHVRICATPLYVCSFQHRSGCLLKSTSPLNY